MQTNSLIERRLVGQAAENEEIDGRQREADKRQDQAEEQEARQRVLAAEAGHLQLVQRVFVDQRPSQVEPLDDVAHAERLFFAQSLAAAVGFGGEAGALLGAQFVALERHRLHAALS